MTKAEVIKYLQQLYPNGGYCWLDEQRIEAISMAIKTLQEEPVNNDLEQAIDTYLATYFGGEKEKQDWPFLKKMAIYFANWQKEQFEKNRLVACDKQTEEEAEIEFNFVMSIIENEHRQPTFDDAIKYGMRLQKKQMMKDATGAIVAVDAGGYPYVDKHIELYDYDKDVPLAKEGDKYKVVLIKED